MDYVDARQWVKEEQARAEKRIEFLHDIATSANQMKIHNGAPNGEQFLATLFNVIHLTLSCETIPLTMAKVSILVEAKIDMTELMDVFMPLDYLEKMALVFGATARHFIDNKMSLINSIDRAQQELLPNHNPEPVDFTQRIQDIETLSRIVLGQLADMMLAGKAQSQASTEGFQMLINLKKNQAYAQKAEEN